jgi:TolA-binding protein
VFVVLALLSGCSTKKYSIDDLYRQAKKAYQRHDYQNARTHYQQFIDDNPESPLNEVTLYYLASSQQNLRDWKAALATYQKLIDTYQSGFWVDLAQQEVEDIQALLNQL